MLLSIGKTPVNKVKSVANDSAKTESSIGAGLHFVDNRPEAVAYRRIQAIKNSHSQMKSAQLKVMNDKSIQGTSNIEITYVELPYKLDSRLNNKSIVQREKFKVEAQEEDDTITGIKISGRPDVKARKNELNDQLALKHPQDFIIN